MAASPVNFLTGFLIFFILLWIVFIFASRLIAWILSEVLGASVGFHVGGWKSLRDVLVQFKKGDVESISIGEIKLSLRQALLKLGVGFVSSDPKLLLLICELEVVIRSSPKVTSKTGAQGAQFRTSGKGKWIVMAHIAKFISVSVENFVVKTPKLTTEIKKVMIDVCKDGGSNPCLLIQLHLLPISVCMDESKFSHAGNVSAGEAPLATLEKPSAILFCDDIFLNCKFGHNRIEGIIINKLDVDFGEVSINFDDTLFLKSKTKFEAYSDTEKSSVNAFQETEPSALTVIMKYISVVPKEVCFNLSKLNMRYLHVVYDLVIVNDIMGIQFKSTLSRSAEDIGESTHLDFQFDLSGIHLAREAGTYLAEIMKVIIVSSVHIPKQPFVSVSAEVDVKLEGTEFNIITSRLKPLLCQWHLSKKQTLSFHQNKGSSIKAQIPKPYTITWTCTVSAPEMIILLYNANDSPLYRGNSQFLHVFANNVSAMGTAVHVELGELNLDLESEYPDNVESNSSLLHVSKCHLDWGKEDAEPFLKDDEQCKSVPSVDVTVMKVYFTYKRVESLLASAFSSYHTLKLVLSSSRGAVESRHRHSSKLLSRKFHFLKLHLGQCCVNFTGDISLDTMLVDDPKHVNYGSQGGRLLVSVAADGTPRRATIRPATKKYTKFRYSVSFEICFFTFHINKDKKSPEFEVERTKSIYREYMGDHEFTREVTLFEMKNVKFLWRSHGHKKIEDCSYFSATNISVRWMPDVHLSLLETVLQLKLVIHNHQVQESVGVSHGRLFPLGGLERGKKTSLTLKQADIARKSESIFVVDLQLITICAEVGDGVDALIQVESIFSENVRIGVLLEEVLLGFNGACVFKSGRLQISHIPSAAIGAPDENVAETMWDLVIQGQGVQVTMPYKLELRAIDDAIEDALRGLKLVIASRHKLLYPLKTTSCKSESSSMTKFGSVKISIQQLTANIEEDPFVGWLVEHYDLMKNEACDLAVKWKYFDEFACRSRCSTGGEMNDSALEMKFIENGVEVVTHDPSAILKIQEEIYMQSFRSYYQACQKLLRPEQSGCHKHSFQTSKASLLCISATNVDLSLSPIAGGDAGMVDVLMKLDPVCLEESMPFSRLYGSNILLRTDSLTIQLRNFTLPLFAATSGKCEGRIILAQQATCFQPQVFHNVFIGRWRIVHMMRSASGTTPAVKAYFDLKLHFQKAEMSFGVGYEPCFADVTYAFVVALRKANLSARNYVLPQDQPTKKERSLPWWDDLRYYVHGRICLMFSETKWQILATTDPYEKLDKLEVATGSLEIQQSDGHVFVSAADFKILLSSKESVTSGFGLTVPACGPGAFLEVPSFVLEVFMNWECDSGNPLNHYLHALPLESESREIVFDPFRSTSLSLQLSISLRPHHSLSRTQCPLSSIGDCTCILRPPTLNFGAHDLAWILKFWNLNYLPPHKLRTFPRWPRFGIPRASRSGNLSLDKVMTEFCLRIDATPCCLKYVPLDDEDAAQGLTFDMNKLKYELCFSRGKQKYKFDSNRDPLDLVYQGFDLFAPKAMIFHKGHSSGSSMVAEMCGESSHYSGAESVAAEKCNKMRDCNGDGFLLSCDYFTIRKQAPKADPERLLAWQEAGRRNIEITYVRSEFENGSESDDQSCSDPSDDDGYNVVIADNCQRVFVYGLKLMWTSGNRDAVWSWVGSISKAFEPPQPSPSRQYALRKLHDLKQLKSKTELLHDVSSESLSAIHNFISSSVPVQNSDTPFSSSVKLENPISAVVGSNESIDSAEEETRHFMVNVVEPQLNLHSEEANGRFLLAAVTGRVLARSFHSVLNVGYEIIEHALGNESRQVPEFSPEMSWKRMEFSVMLEHVQAHVAPTDVDPGAGLQWLPKIYRTSPKVKRTGVLLERVFMPCDMYLRYTRHKGGTSDLKVKPLKELIFNSHNIIASMTSPQFQVMLDVLTNLLFARVPRPRKFSMPYPDDDEDCIDDEALEVVPNGIEEVELAKVNLELSERELNLLIRDIRTLSLNDSLGDLHHGIDGSLWMITGERSRLVHGLKKELVIARKRRKSASVSLRLALRNAAHVRLMEKEKSKSPSCAMRISLQIRKVVWSMLMDNKSFAEAEINDLIFDFDRDYKDVGVALFTTKYFVVRNCLPYGKSDMVLSPWNPPPDWGKKVMLRIDAKQGSLVDGTSRIDLFQVEIYPLKIYLTEIMYRMMWEYFFPEEEQESLRREEVWKVSKTGARRIKKGSLYIEDSCSHIAKESDVSLKNAGNVAPELRRASSFDRTWEENIAETVATELVLQANSSGIDPSKSESPSSNEQPDALCKVKSRESRHIKAGRSFNEEKKVGKIHDDKSSRPRKLMEFHNIKISQVELQLTYESSRFNLNELKLLMDTFHRSEFHGTWRRLFSRVKKHVVWGTLKSVTGMQGKKFKDKTHSQHSNHSQSVVLDHDLNFSDNDEDQAKKSDQYPNWLKRPTDGAGDRFVTSIKGLFNTQRRKAKAFVLRTMRGGESESDFHGEWSGSDVEFSPFARQLTITKAKRLIRQHTKKLQSRGQKGSSSRQRDSVPSSLIEATPFNSDSSDIFSPYEDFH